MIADAGALGELAPSSVFPLIQSKTLDSLPQREVLTQADNVEDYRFRKFEHQFRRGNIIIGRPVPIRVRAQQIFRGELFGLATHIAGHEPRRLSQVMREG